MTNNDVAIITSIAAGLSALLASAITALITYRLTARSIAASASEAVATRTHETDEAWTDRQQTRLLDAYQSVARHVGHWTRQIQWAVNQQTFTTNPPTPQPRVDEIDYSSEALIALVGSDEVWQELREFNASVTRYLVAVGVAVQVEGFVVPTMPETTRSVTVARNTARDAGYQAISQGKTALDRMRAELQPDRQQMALKG